MSQPETKTVLGRVFTWDDDTLQWCCQLNNERTLKLEKASDNEHVALLFDWDADVTIECDSGPTESDAILALQSTLRKMAELEVSK